MRQKTFISQQEGQEVSTNLLLSEIKKLIESAKRRVTYSANSELVMLYWSIGKQLEDAILLNKRAEYGEQIIATVSRQLSFEYGRGFSKAAIFRMVQFYKLFPQHEIVATVSQQLSWSHLIELIPLEPKIKRDFYIEMCRIESWSVRTLRDKIDGMLYERTAISKKPEELASAEIAKLQEKNQISIDLVLKDPYLLDFLNLKDTYNEKDLEQAILNEIEKFILELGSDFCFIARQKRISIGNEDYYIDLLMYNRALRRIIAIELKMGKFKAADKGQMELYLRWLDKYERKSGEESPLGIILCTDKNHEQVELLELAQNSIHVQSSLHNFHYLMSLKEHFTKPFIMLKRGSIKKMNNYLLRIN